MQVRFSEICVNQQNWQFGIGGKAYRQLCGHCSRALSMRRGDNSQCFDLLWIPVGDELSCFGVLIRKVWG
jgi:hypothetical protein